MSTLFSNLLISVTLNSTVLPLEIKLLSYITEGSCIDPWASLTVQVFKKKVFQEKENSVNFRTTILSWVELWWYLCHSSIDHFFWYSFARLSQRLILVSDSMQFILKRDIFAFVFCCFLFYDELTMSKKWNDFLSKTSKDSLLPNCFFLHVLLWMLQI